MIILEKNKTVEKIKGIFDESPKKGWISEITEQDKQEQERTNQKAEKDLYSPNMSEKRKNTPDALKGRTNKRIKGANDASRVAINEQWGNKMSDGNQNNHNSPQGQPSSTVEQRHTQFTQTLAERQSSPGTFFEEFLKKQSEQKQQELKAEQDAKAKLSEYTVFDPRVYEHNPDTLREKGEQAVKKPPQEALAAEQNAQQPLKKRVNFDPRAYVKRNQTQETGTTPTLKNRWQQDKDGKWVDTTKNNSTLKSLT